MKHILISAFILTLLISCNNSKQEKYKKSGRLELPEPDQEVRLLGEAIQRLRNKNCTLIEPDTSICGVSLRNSETANKVFGIDKKINEKEQYQFYSNLDNETLIVSQYPGDIKNQVSLFTVYYSDKVYHGYKQLKIETFETEKGVKLGLTKQQLVNKLGTCYEIVDSTKDCLQLYYRIENPKDSRTKILARHNMPVYFGTYTFYNDKLKYFKFGFEYP